MQAPSATSRSTSWLQEAYRHCKTIAAWGDGAELLGAAGLDPDAPGMVDSDTASAEGPHSFATAADERVPAHHDASRARGSVADWQPHGVGHAVARDTGSGLCQNTTLCGKSVYNLHLFAELAFARGAATCPDCSTIFMSRRRVRSPVSATPERV